MMISGSISPLTRKDAMAWKSKSKFLFHDKAGNGIAFTAEEKEWYLHNYSSRDLCSFYAFCPRKLVSKVFERFQICMLAWQQSQTLQVSGCHGAEGITKQPESHVLHPSPHIHYPSSLDPQVRLLQTSRIVSMPV